MHNSIDPNLSKDERLRILEERCRLLAKAAHEAIYDWDLTTNVLSWSEGISMLFGHSLDQIGTGIEWWTDNLHPDEKEEVTESLNQAIHEKQPYWSAQYRFRKVDGTYAHVQDRGYLVYDQERPLRMVGVILDITEQKMYESERVRLLSQLKDEKRRLDDLISSLPGVVWEGEYDASGAPLKTVFVSEYLRELLGYAPEQWTSNPGFWASVVVPEDREMAIASAIPPEPPDQVRITHFRMLTADQRTVWVEVRAVPVKDDHGKIVGLRGVSLDVTERVRIAEEREKLLKQIQEALVRAEAAVQLRDEFLAIASHELKTPLTSIKVQSQSLLRYQRSGRLASLPKDTLERMLVTGDAAINKLTSLVYELLDVSAMSSGRLSLTLTDFDFRDLVEEVLDRYRPEMEASEIQVRSRCGENLAGRWDRSRLDQALTNLLSNALKYGRGKPVEIDARFSEDGSELQFSVKDEGIGIALQDQARIFNRFERAASPRHFGGFGLGLYITKGIIELHGGTIHLQSQPEAGSTFTVRLPRFCHASKRDV